MATPPDIKRLTVEDFKPEDRALVRRLAFPINSFFEQVRNALNGNINFTNINQDIVTIDVTVNGSGVPSPSLTVRHNVSGTVLGVTCINARNLTDSTTTPTGTPWINHTQDGQILRVSSITNLQSSNKYRLTL